MEKETIKVTFYASTGFVNSTIEKTIEIDKKEWENMDFEDKNILMYESLNALDLGWYENE